MNLQEKIIFAIVVIMVLTFIGGFTIGSIYTKNTYIRDVDAQLNKLLQTNFSYVCGANPQQFYIKGISISGDAINE